VEHCCATLTSRGISAITGHYCNTILLNNDLRDKAWKQLWNVSLLQTVLLSNRSTGVLSSHKCQYLKCGTLCCFPSETWYAFLVCHMRVTYPDYLIVRNLINLILMWHKYKLWRSPRSNFLHPAAASSLRSKYFSRDTLYLHTELMYLHINLFIYSLLNHAAHTSDFCVKWWSH
jgi:hypothetical protein